MISSSKLRERSILSGTTGSLIDVQKLRFFTRAREAKIANVNIEDELDDYLKIGASCIRSLL